MAFRYPVLDPELCTRCHACEIACVEARYGGGPYQPDDVFVLERRRLAVRDWGELPTLDVCTHCAEAPCVPVCPHLALLRFRDGRVELREDRCTGCGKCIGACSFRAIRRVTELGIAVKCDGCMPLNREPACVAACPSGALSLVEGLPGKTTAG